MPKKGSFERKKKFNLDHSLVFIFSSPIKLFCKKSLKNYDNNISLPWGLFVLEHIFCHSHHKTCWTMLVDNVDLNICLLGTSNFMVTLIFFSLVYTKVVPRRVPQPITTFTGPWDNFMVHGVNNPLVLQWSYFLGVVLHVNYGQSIHMTIQIYLQMMLPPCGSHRWLNKQPVDTMR